MKNIQKKWIAWVLLLCLALSGMGTALGEEQKVYLSDFENLEPLMDAVAGAAILAHEDPQSIPGEEGVLDASFVNAFFNLAVAPNYSLGILEDALASTAKQAEDLGRIFAAKAPELTPIDKMDGINGYLGFCPMTVNTAAEAGSIQIIGEIYWGATQLQGLSEADFAKVQWLERAIFTFRQDETAFNGFRLMGFSQGTDLNMEEIIQNYFEAILTEYVNTTLGFVVQYPSVFSDELLMENETGMFATLPDDSASFFAKRIENTNKANLADYVTVIAGGIDGAESQINEEFQYATLTYKTAEGNTVFDVYIVTDKYIYQAQLSYRSELNGQFHMYTTYLENTFMVEELSFG